MTEIDNEIPFSGVDPKGRLKLAVLLEMFQEMADIDASKHNISVRQTLEHNITWVLRNYRIDLEKYPTKESESIRIQTYAEPIHNLFSLRTYKLWDSKGVYLGIVSTWWVLIDIIKQRPLRLNKCELMDTFTEQLTEELPINVKVPKLTNAQIEEVWKVRWQDLDVNDHTNHAVYFSWALDTVPNEVPENMVPVFVEGEFLRPIPRTRVRCLTEEVQTEKGRLFLHSLRHVENETEYARLLSHWF